MKLISAVNINVIAAIFNNCGINANLILGRTSSGVKRTEIERIKNTLHAIGGGDRWLFLLACIAFVAFERTQVWTLHCMDSESGKKGSHSSSLTHLYLSYVCNQ